MKKIFSILVFVAAISFFVCNQDLTGYEPKIGLTTIIESILLQR